VLKTLKDNIDEFADLNKLCLLDSEASIDVSVSSWKEKNVTLKEKHLHAK
jgi:hypothetical protein